MGLRYDPCDGRIEFLFATLGSSKSPLSVLTVAEQNLPAIRPFTPPEGITFYTERAEPLAAVAHDLCMTAALLQHRELYAKLILYEDWWQHDGLHFQKGSLDFHGLFRIIGTPRSLASVMPGDDQVFVGVAPEDRSWYLRFWAGWDGTDENLVAEFSITLPEELSRPFGQDVLPNLTCALHQEDAGRYFDRTILR